MGRIRVLNAAVIVAETLEAWFDLEDNSGNQGIVQSENSNDDQPSPEEYKVAYSSSIVNRQNISVAIQFSDNSEGENDSEDSFECYSGIVCCSSLCNRG